MNSWLWNLPTIESINHREKKDGKEETRNNTINHHYSRIHPTQQLMFEVYKSCPILAQNDTLVTTKIFNNNIIIIFKFHYKTNPTNFENV